MPHAVTKCSVSTWYQGWRVPVLSVYLFDVICRALWPLLQAQHLVGVAALAEVQAYTRAAHGAAGACALSGTCSPGETA